MKNGQLYIWGPTPIGQFNSPQHFQDLISNDMTVVDVSIGTSFGLIKDNNQLSYQIGSLFHENRNSTNFQFLDNLNFHSFACGHDFVVASIISQTEKTQVNSSSSATKSKSSLLRSNTQSTLTQRNHKKRNTSELNPKLSLQVQNPSYNLNTQASLNPKIFDIKDSSNISPLRISKNGFMLDSNISSNAYNSRYSVVHQSQQQQILAQSNNHHDSNNIHNQSMHQNLIKELKHHDSCTPVRDYTPNNGRMHQTPSQSNTPNTVRLRIQNPQQYNHGLSYQTDNDILNQTIINTPQQLRRTFAGIPPQTLTSQPSQYNPSTSTTPPPYQNCHYNNQPHFLNSSHTVFPGFFQSLDQQQFSSQVPFQQQQQQQQQQPQQPSQQPQQMPLQSIDFIIKEKQELHHQITVEIQRRLILEKELSELYRQIESMRSTNNNQQELQRLLEMSKHENETLLAQCEEIQNDNEKMSHSIEQIEHENLKLKREQEDLNNRLQNSIRENEYLKSRVELSQMNVGGDTKTKEMEEILQKKNKEIYELTVQLGCLKEENHQLKRDQDDMSEDFKERLRHQQIRAEADYLQIQEENQDLLKQISQYKELSDELKSLKQLQESKNTQILEFQQVNELLNAKVQEQEDTIKIQRRELVILQSEQEKLLKRLNNTNQSSNKSPLKRDNQENINQKRMRIDDEELDIEDIKRAANEILTCSSSKTNVMQQNQNIENHRHQDEGLERTQRSINPIQTPIESERKLKGEFLFHKMKQSMIDVTKPSNKETGCLQINSVQNQRRKSTHGGYNQQVKTLRQSTQKSTTNLNANTSKTQQKTPGRGPSHLSKATTIQQLISKSPVSITHKRQSKQTTILPTSGPIETEEMNNSTLDMIEAQPHTTIHNASNQNKNRAFFNNRDNHHSNNAHNKTTNFLDQDSLDGGCFKGIENMLHTPKQQTQNLMQQNAYSALGMHKNSLQSQSSNNLIGASKNNLGEMKSKLADIQNNKLFLEKKISEYERKLNELKGINTENHGHHSGRGQHSSSIHNNKINTLTNAILERVIKEAKK